MTLNGYGTPAREWQRMLRFLVVGASGTAVDITLFCILTSVGLAILAANVLAYSVGIVNNFAWNRQWTYADARTKPVAVQMSQFTFVSVIGLVLNTVLVLGMEALLAADMPSTTWPALGAKGAATVAVVAWNWLANRHWTFKDAR